MILGLDSYKKLEVPPFVLCKPNGEKLNAIPCTEKKGTMKFNDYDEISFTTYLYIDGKKNDVYDKINELMYIELPEIGRYIITEIDISSEGTKLENKSCVALSEEVALAQKYLERFIINRGETGSVEQNNETEKTEEEILSVNNVKFFNPEDQKRSLLHLILNEKAPGWSIKHVDNELRDMERRFNVDRQDIYSFLTKDVSEAFECIFVFNTIKHEIFVYKEENAGIDTDIHISYSNLAKTINISSSTDDIKTCLTVKGKDDLNIREVNMGYDRIYNLDYFHSKEYMSHGEQVDGELGLYDAYTVWKEKWNNGSPLYEYLVGGVITKTPTDKEKNEGKVFEPSGKAWVYYNTDVAGVKLIDEKNKTNPQNYVWGYQRIFDKIYYLESSMMPSSEEVNAINEKEKAIREKNNAHDKITSKDASKKKFQDEEIFTRYGLNPLKGKLDAYNQEKDTYIKTGIAQKEIVNKENNKKEENKEYWKYENVLAAIEVINEEITKRTAEINKWKTQQSEIKKQMDNLVNDLKLENNFTKKQHTELWKFIREDELSSDNYLTTSTDTDADRIEWINKLLEHGKKELAKVSIPTLEFSLDMVNLHAIPEFKNKLSKFDVGNYMYVTLRDDFSVKVKLLAMDINFLDQSDFSVTFGNIAKVRGSKLLQDVTEALSLASDAATSVSFNASTWNKANVNSTEISEMINSGLLNAGKTLKTINNDVIIDQYGITISNNPTEGKDTNGNPVSYKDDTIFIGGGQILFSSDRLNTIRTALGRLQYTNLKGEYVDDFGLIANFVIAGYIAGTDISASHFVGGDIKSTNYEEGKYGSYIDLENGLFEFNGGGEQKLTLTKEGNDYTLTVKGNIKADSGYIGKEGDKGFTISSNKETGYGYISSGGKTEIENVKEGIYIGADGISLGKTTTRTASDGTKTSHTPFKVDNKGHLIATSGEIGGFTLSETAIYNGKTSISDSKTGVYLGTDGIALGASSAFHVTSSGVLTAKSGYIGGATITDGSIYVPKNTKNTRAIQNPKDVKWAINSNGTATFTNVYIEGVQPGSNFGGTNGISFNIDGSGLSGNFANGFSAGYSFNLNGGALNNFNNLVANKISANYITSAVINAGFVTADTLTATNANILGQLNALEAKFDSLTSIDTNSFILSCQALYVEGKRIYCGSNGAVYWDNGTILNI